MKSPKVVINLNKKMSLEEGRVIVLTLPVPSLLVPTPYTHGGGGGGWMEPPPKSKNCCSNEHEICMVLKTSLNVLEMLKFFT